MLYRKSPNDEGDDELYAGDDERRRGSPLPCWEAGAWRESKRLTLGSGSFDRLLAVLTTDRKRFGCSSIFGNRIPAIDTWTLWRNAVGLDEAQLIAPLGDNRTHLKIQINQVILCRLIRHVSMPRVWLNHTSSLNELRWGVRLYSTT